MILINVEYKKSLDIVDKYRQSHMDYLSKFYDDGLILASGPYNNRSGGFIISVMDLESAKEYVRNDPFYLNDIGDFDIKDFIPTKSSLGFRNLINGENFSKDGRELFNQLHGKHAGEQLIKALSKIAPDFSKLTFDFAFESIFARDTEMSMLTKELITIAVCCAIGDCQAQVQSHLEAAINLGASKDMIVETLLLVSPFAGFPRVANSLLAIDLG
ncbi:MULTISPECIES: carboxymuconolactone decarboxylase family protein [Francisella]|uniref:Carboxymuconolactone decarboxylase family protein n=3 Tax=Francisella TaxID=262 RepID=A0ABS1GDY0_9GAMM|nr:MULTISPECIES: carboxymuconolactone decarboxylase family protein [Francisella]MBK2095445.1 carboxymuconolactone decarboxylase family protein [Francisella philomiragia]MBK2259429.1 carboxymuconolactone decarboxylase family protein [Francisella philomiragia]MBK2303043.1 carboxymuconolactone decarboxylase family protein [Francisella philomiragia]QEO58142.1 carboxymuconolactone decarboxylase [Francisella marina]QEO59630.1 carboxymuconolactone decarboxylase [Francisella marina]